jgi:hypothetical protein
MNGKRVKLLICTSVFVGAMSTLTNYAQGPASKIGGAPAIPTTWDDQAMASLQVPFAEAAFSPVHVSSELSSATTMCPLFSRITF